VAYFTKAELEKYIGQEVSAEEYTYAEAFARDFIERYTGQVFEFRYFEEVVAPDDVIILRGYPVSFARLYSYPERKLIDPDMYIVHDWGIQLRERPPYPLLLAAYNAGWMQTPPEVKEVAMWIAKRILVPLDKPTPTVQSLSAGGTSMTFLTADWQAGRPTEDDWVNSILNAYRRPNLL